MDLKSSTVEKNFKWFHLIMFILYLLILINTFLMGTTNKLIILILSLIHLGLIVIRHLTMKKINKLLRILLPIVEAIILFFIIYFDSIGASLGIVPILSIDIALDYEDFYVVSYGIVTYVLSMLLFMAKAYELPLEIKIIVFIIGAVQYTLFIGFANLFKKYSLQSVKLTKTTGELHAQVISMEQLTLLKERNRITEKIHNSVGHQLTTALVQIEATQMLMDIDSQEAKRRLSIIKEQVREGLNEIRKSIHAINATQEYENLETSIIRLVERVRNHTGIDIDIVIEEVEDLKLQLKEIIYNIIIESMTNAIRHGQCSKIKICLRNEKGFVTLNSYNNGSVPNELKFGYGLNQIKQNLKAVGGNILHRLNEDGWFGLEVSIPIYHVEGDNHV